MALRCASLGVSDERRFSNAEVVSHAADLTHDDVVAHEVGPNSCPTRASGPEHNLFEVATLAPP